MRKAFMMIELTVVLIGITILIQLMAFCFSTLKDRSSYEFITVNDRCEVVCALDKPMP